MKGDDEFPPEAAFGLVPGIAGCGSFPETGAPAGISR
jgi:hypothetical protein